MWMLMQDDACLWWVIPAARLAEFEALLDSEAELPDWAHGPFASPSDLRFGSWQEP